MGTLKNFPSLNLKNLTSNQQAVLDVFLLFCLALLFRLVFFTGFAAFDDETYINAALTLLSGSPYTAEPQSLHWLHRLGLILPTAGMFKFFGISIFSGILLPLIFSVFRVGLMYAFGRLVFNRSVAWMAALLLVVNPADISFSTTVMPDIPLAFWMELSALMIFLGMRKMRDWTDKTKWTFFSSGIFLGLAYMNKESALVMLLVYAIWILSSGLPKRMQSLIWIAAGFFLIFLLECALFQHLTGDALARIHHQLSVGKYYSRIDLKQYFSFFPRLVLPMSESFHYYLFFVSSLFFLQRRRKLSLFLKFLIWVGIYDGFILTRMGLIAVDPRTWLIPVEVPFCLMVAFMFNELSESSLGIRNKRKWISIGAGLGCLSAAFFWFSWGPGLSRFLQMHLSQELWVVRGSRLILASQDGGAFLSLLCFYGCLLIWQTGSKFDSALIRKIIWSAIFLCFALFYFRMGSRYSAVSENRIFQFLKYQAKQQTVYLDSRTNRIMHFLARLENKTAGDWREISFLDQDWIREKSLRTQGYIVFNQDAVERYYSAPGDRQKLHSFYELVTGEGNRFNNQPIKSFEWAGKKVLISKV